MRRGTKGGAAARVGLAAVLAAAMLAPEGLGEAAAQTTPAALPAITLSVTELSDTYGEDPRWTPATSIAEVGRGWVRVVATASAAVAEQVSLSVTVGGAGSTAGKGPRSRSLARAQKADYHTTADSVTVTIAAGETSGSSGDIVITTREDNLVEGDETIRFTAEAPAGYPTIPAAELVLLDEDDDIQLLVSPETVVEGTAETVTVTAGFRSGRSSALTSDTDVTVTVASGDGPNGATLGSSGDFTTDAKGNQVTVTIPAGKVGGNATFTLTASSDDADEGVEKGNLTGTASVGGSAVTVSGNSIGIVDPSLGVGLTVDADADTPGIQSSLGEDAGKVTVRVTASLASGTAPSGGLTIGISAWGVHPARGRLNERGGRSRVYKGPSSFRAGDDYWVIYPSDQSPRPPRGDYLAIRIPQGKSSGSADITVAMNDDQVAEDEETLLFTGGDVSAGGNTYRIVAARVSLIDNDGNDPTPDAESIGVKPSIVLSFTNGQSAVASVDERAGRQQVRVVATASAAVTEQVSLSVAVGGAGSTAGKGRGKGYDYVTSADSATVTIAAGETSGSSGDIFITPGDDYLVEGDETIRFTAEAPAGYQAIPAAELVLLDEDDDIGLRVSPTTVAEGTSETVTVTTRFFGASSELTSDTDVTVTVASGDGPNAATLGSSGDFTTDAKGNQFTVTIPAGKVGGNATFTLTAAADNADENVEKGKLTGTASVGGSAVTVEGTRIRIVDPSLSVKLTVDADADAPGIQSSLGEDAGEVTVRVTASLASGTAPSGGLTIGVKAFGVGANQRLKGYKGPSSFRAGDDIWIIFPSGQSPPPPRGYDLAIRIPQGKSSGSADMTVVMHDDQVAEDEETLRFEGRDVAAGGNIYRIVAAQVRLIDNDGNDPPPAAESIGVKPSIVLSLTDTSIEEAAGGRVRVVATASAAVAEQVSVSVTVGGAGSTAGKGSRADYRTTADSVTVTIAAGETSGSSGNIWIDTWEDFLVEGNETIRFTAETPAGYQTIPATELVVIDEETDISLFVSPVTVVEGTSETVTVTAQFFGASSVLTSDTDVTVTVASGDGPNGATLGSSGDFTTDAKGNQFTVTIPAGRIGGSAAFTLTAVADAVDERFEQGKLTGTASVVGSAVAVVNENLEQGERTGSVSVGGSAVTVLGRGIGIVDARFGVGLTVDADTDTPGIQSSLNEDAGEVTARVTASLASGTAPSGGLTIGMSVWGVGATGRLNERGVGSPRVYEGPSSFEAWDDYWIIYPSGQSPPPPFGHYLAIRIPEGKSSGSAELTVVMNDDQVAEGEEGLLFVGGDVTAGGNTYKTVAAQVRLIDNDGNPPAPNVGAPPVTNNGNGGAPPVTNGNGGTPPVTNSDGGTPPPDADGAPESPASACVGRFCDEDDSVHQANTERIAQWRITLGCSAADPTLFCPGADITRRQMAAFLYRAVSQRWTIQAPARAELSDVADDAWFRTYADWVISVDAFAAPGGVFNPGGVVTRADMAVMMIAAFPHLEAVAEPEGLFQDVQDSDPAVIRAIEGLYRAGVTRGCSTGPLNYCPDQPVTRAQMASYFVRAIDRAPAA